MLPYAATRFSSSASPCPPFQPCLSPAGPHLSYTQSRLPPSPPPHFASTPSSCSGLGVAPALFDAPVGLLGLHLQVCQPCHRWLQLLQVLHSLLQLTLPSISASMCAKDTLSGQDTLISQDTMSALLTTAAACSCARHNRSEKAATNFSCHLTT